ncbi:hypothetical protein [Williamsia sp.]|uniref:hypothetical protein n=1 Tax=Williamsia sp. TaxID=1872085 RepID=UPI001A2DBD7A|nr:hypothetical protein [Williamsia sp.]MBJ7289268.1 hypothetical protein [Williamsia sp.]
MTTNNPPPGEYDPSQQAAPYPYGPPQGYGPPQNYGPPPGYGPPQTFGPPPGYGPGPGYGPPQNYGPPSGYAQQYYGSPQGYVPPPSSATAIIAAILAFLGGIAATVALIGDILIVAAVTDVDGPSWFSGYAGFEGVISLVRLGLLVTGGVLLIRRRGVGRVLVLAGCALTIVMVIVGVIILASISVANGVPGVVGSGYGVFLGLVFPAVTIVLLLVSPTTRWLRSA